MAGNSVRCFAAGAAPSPAGGLTKPLSSTPATEDDANSWIITLSDLTMLLLGFLVCWYVMNKTPSPTATPPVAARAIAMHKPPVEAPMTGELSQESWQAMQRNLANFIAQAGLANQVTLESRADEIVLSLKDTVPFASGKATLRAQVMPMLEKVVAVVIGQPNLSVAISGHTDSLRIATAEFPSNWELSAARASRVARYLVKRGVPPSRIAIQGYADRRPRRPNSTPINRSANRRVELRLFHDTESGRAPATDAGAR